jgi:hypothetical protein
MPIYWQFLIATATVSPSQSRVDRNGVERTTPDKQNAVKTVLTNPLVSCDENGVPWTDRAIARICKVHWNTVAKWRAEYLEKSPDRAVTRGGTTYTMNTANIGHPGNSQDKLTITAPTPASRHRRRFHAPGSRSGEAVMASGRSGVGSVLPYAHRRAPGRPGGAGLR